MANTITFAVMHQGACHILSGEKREDHDLTTTINTIIADAQIEGYQRLAAGDIFINLKDRRSIQNWTQAGRFEDHARLFVPAGAVEDADLVVIVNRLTLAKQVLETATLNFTTALAGDGQNLDVLHQKLEAAKKNLIREQTAYSQTLGDVDILDECATALGQAHDMTIYASAYERPKIIHTATDEANLKELVKAAAKKYAEIKTYYTTGKGRFASKEHKDLEVAKAVAAIKVYYGKLVRINSSNTLRAAFVEEAENMLGSYHVDLQRHARPFRPEEFSSRAVSYLLNGKNFSDSSDELDAIEDRAVFSTKQSLEIPKLKELKQKLRARGDQTEYTKLLTRGLGWVAMGPVIGARALMYGRERTFDEIIQIANGKSDGDWLPQFPSRGAISDQEREYLKALLESKEEGVQYEEARVQAAKKLAIACDAKARQILESHAGGRKSIAQTCSDIKAINIASQRGVDLKAKTIEARNSSLVQLANVSDAMLHDVFPQLEMLGRIHFDIFPTNVLGLMTPAVRGIWNSGAILNNFETLQERIKGSRVFGGDGLVQVLEKAIDINEAYFEAHKPNLEAASQVLEDYEAMLKLIPSYTSRLHNSAGDEHVETKQYPGFKTAIGTDLMDIKKKLEGRIASLQGSVAQYTAQGFAVRLTRLITEENQERNDQISALLSSLSQGTRILVPNAHLRAQYYNAIAESLAAYETAVNARDPNADQIRQTFTALAEDINRMVPQPRYDDKGKIVEYNRGVPRVTDFNRFEQPEEV